MTKKGQNKNQRLLFVIRLLILLIFITALVICAKRLMEFNRKEREAEELEREKARIEEAERPPVQNAGE